MARSSRSSRSSASPIWATALSALFLGATWAAAAGRSLEEQKAARVLGCVGCACFLFGILPLWNKRLSGLLFPFLVFHTRFYLFLVALLLLIPWRPERHFEMLVSASLMAVVRALLKWMYRYIRNSTYASLSTGHNLEVLALEKYLLHATGALGIEKVLEVPEVFEEEENELEGPSKRAGEIELRAFYRKGEPQPLSIVQVFDKWKRTDSEGILEEYGYGPGESLCAPQGPRLTPRMEDGGEGAISVGSIRRAFEKDWAESRFLTDTYPERKNDLSTDSSSTIQGNSTQGANMQGANSMQPSTTTVQSSTMQPNNSVQDLISIQSAAQPSAQIAKHATALFALISYGEKARIRYDTFCETFRQISLERVNLYHAVKDCRQLLRHFHGFLCLIEGVLLFLTTTIALSMENLFLHALFSFSLVHLVVPGSVGFFESFIFLLLAHPYDCGDRVILRGQNMIVKKVGLFATRFTTWQGIHLTMQNNVISKLPIQNIRRSVAQYWSVEIPLSITCSNTAMLNLKKRISAYAEEEKTLSGFLFAPDSVVDSNTLVLRILVKKRSNFQNGFFTLGGYTKCLAGIIQIVKDEGLFYLPPAARFRATEKDVEMLAAAITGPAEGNCV